MVQFSFQVQNLARLREMATEAGDLRFSSNQEGCIFNEKLDYNNLTKEELVDQIRKLKIHVQQLRNVIRRDQAEASADSGRPLKKARKARQFDFSKHPRRHVALKVAYLGWDYQGLAVQEDTDNTIEAHVFDALLKARLIEERVKSNYHRCGRTDKGVSAFCQVLSIDLRCKCTSGIGVIPPIDGYATETQDVEELSEEIDYCKILNAILPKDIRVLAWSPVRTDFSARFDCKQRTYRYFLPRGNANVASMQEAGQYLVGEHDFQNFCKPDTSSGEVKSTTRRILSFDIRSCNGTGQSSYDILELEIKGQAFLWHQIRCIVSILILVGQGLEEPETVKSMLDLSKFPKKPQYSMAMDYPLVLFETSHGEDIRDWFCSSENRFHVIKNFQSLWAQQSLKAQMLLEMLNVLESESSDASHGEESSEPQKPLVPCDHLTSLIMGTKTKTYKPLQARPVCGNSATN